MLLREEGQGDEHKEAHREPDRGAERLLCFSVCVWRDAGGKFPKGGGRDKTSHYEDMPRVGRKKVPALQPALSGLVARSQACCHAIATRVYQRHLPVQRYSDGDAHTWR